MSWPMFICTALTTIKDQATSAAQSRVRGAHSFTAATESCLRENGVVGIVFAAQCRFRDVEPFVSIDGADDEDRVFG